MVVLEGNGWFHQEVLYLIIVLCLYVANRLC